MNIVKSIKWRYKVINTVFRYLYSMMIVRKQKMIFLFGSPAHSNMGDQAQSYCLQKWINANYPEYGILFFRLPETYNSLLKALRRTIRKDDKIVCHSGYHMTDLYNEQDVYCKLAQLFPERPIWIFPQTVLYKNEENLIKTANIMNSHGRVTLMARDEISYATAQKYFTGCKVLLYPDIVTSLIGTKQFNYERDGVLFCVRNDIEAFYSKEQIQTLKNKFAGVKVEQTDTTLKVNYKEIVKNREYFINHECDYYSHFKVIITDRYHGTILSLISGTPVVVLKTSDHKLSSGVKWFPEEFKDYVTFAENLDEAYEKAVMMMNKQLTHQLPPYFKENYYDKLKAILEDDRN